MEATTTPDCLCVTYAFKQGIDVPAGWNADDFTPNSIPTVGALALFKYRNGIYHVAPITSLHEWGVTIAQDGVAPCNNPSDEVKWDDPNLRGFWTRQGR